MLALWERGLFGAGPDWPLVLVLPREEWAVSAAAALRGFIAVPEEEEEVMVDVPEEKDCWRSRAK